MFPRFAILLGLLALTARSGSAQTVTSSWVGTTNGNWTTSTNWRSPNGAPPLDSASYSGLTRSVVLFDGTTTRIGTTNNLTGLKLYQIRVGSPTTAGTVTIGGNAITLGAGGIDLSSATRDLTLSAPLTVTADQLWAVPSGRTLAVSGILSGTNNLTIAGNSSGGTVNLTAARTRSRMRLS